MPMTGLGAGTRPNGFRMTLKRIVAFRDSTTDVGGEVRSDVRGTV